MLASEAAATSPYQGDSVTRAGFAGVNGWFIVIWGLPSILMRPTQKTQSPGRHVPLTLAEKA